jgi:hypothetical protein
MIHAIVSADARRDHTVSITWADGVCGVVDMVPYIARGGLFAALDDPDNFVQEMRMLPGGIGLTWPDDLDFSADGLRQDASNLELTILRGHVRV